MDIHAVMPDTVVIRIVVVVHGAFDQDHRALSEVFVNKQRCLTPCSAAEEISLDLAVLCRLIDCDRKPQILLAAVCLLHGEVGSDATHDNDSVQHCDAPDIRLTDEQRADFIRSMKIGYYRIFYKQGLITAEQLAELIEMQTKGNQSASA